MLQKLVFGRQRVEVLPDVPPLIEIGVKDFEAASWFMLVAPGRTPTGIVERIYAELRTFGSDPGVRKEFAGVGLVPVASAPPDELKTPRQVGDRPLGQYRPAGGPRRNPIDTAVERISPCA